MGQVKKGQLDVGFAFSYAISDTNYNRSQVVTNRDGERATTRSVTLEIEQGVTENLGATLSVGYAGVDHFVLNSAGVLSVSGFTDLSVGVFYDLFGDTELKQSSRAKNVLSHAVSIPLASMTDFEDLAPTRPTQIDGFAASQSEFQSLIPYDTQKLSFNELLEVSMTYERVTPKSFSEYGVAGGVQVLHGEPLTHEGLTDYPQHGGGSAGGCTAGGGGHGGH